MGGSSTTNINPQMSGNSNFQLHDIVSGSKNNRLQNLMYYPMHGATVYNPDMHLQHMINLKPVLSNVGKGALNGAIGAIHFWVETQLHHHKIDKYHV